MIELGIDLLLEEETVETIEEVESQASESALSEKDVNIAEEHDAAVSNSRNGKASLCFITVGKGTSGYYTEEVLKNSAHLFEGRPMYVDHHKNVKDPGIVYWAGDIQSAYYDPNGIDGAGIYGTASVLPRWKEMIEGMIDSKGGVSIKARGKTDESGLIKSISVVESVDYVVRAGRGGRVMDLFESAIAPVEEIVEEVTSNENKEQTMGTSAEDNKETTETQSVTEEKKEVTTEVTENASESSAKTDAPVIDMDAIRKMFVETLDEKMAGVESRLALIEREGSDRDKVKAAVKEAAGEDLSEDMCKQIETLVWGQRREGVDLEEQAKLMVESWKPVYASIKAEADKKIEEAKKISSKQNVPTILEHMSKAYAGDDGKELTEAELEKELAGSVARIIDTDDVKKIEDTIVNSRGE